MSARRNEAGGGGLLTAWRLCMGLPLMISASRRVASALFPGCQGSAAGHLRGCRVEGAEADRVIIGHKG